MQTPRQRRRPGRASRPSFFPSISKSEPFSSKDFQRILWRFRGISRVCNRCKPKVSAAKLFRRLAPKNAFAPRSTDEADGAFESNLTRLTFFRKRNWRPRIARAGYAIGVMIGPPVSASFGQRRHRTAGPDAAATGRPTRRIALFSLAAGLLGLAGLVCLATHAFFGLGVGGMERVTAYPFTLWIGCMGAWLLRGAEERRASRVSRSEWG